jgi:quercetin dioxygenase-like cupin family protein
MIGPLEGELLWFLDTLVQVRIPTSRGTDGLSVLENRAPLGDSPPLHVHRTQDEVFHVIEGVMRFRLGETERVVAAGSTLLAPKGVPHTYRVDSPEASWLTVTTGGDFERFVRALSRPATEPALPPAAAPTPEAVERLIATAATFGIEIVGPPWR